MAADVVQRADSRAAVSSVVVDTIVPEKFEACDVPADCSKRSIGYRFGDRPEVVIPPTVLIDAQEATGRSRYVDEAIRLRHGDGEWLIDDYVAPRSEGKFGEVGVCSRRSCDNDEFDQGIVKQALWVSDLGHPRVATRHFVSAPRHDRAQLE
jgi:hypothetical protein